MKKRLLALMLTLAICVTFMPTVFFQSVEEVNAASYLCEVEFNAGEHGEFAAMPVYDDDPGIDYGFYYVTNHKKLAVSEFGSDTDGLFWIPELPSMTDGVYTWLKDVFASDAFSESSIGRTIESLLENLFPNTFIDGFDEPNVVVIPDNGYVFKGWYTQPTGGEMVDFTSLTSGTHKFYAQYGTESATPQHTRRGWNYITSDYVYEFIYRELLAQLDVQRRTFTDKEWKALCKNNSLLEKAFALCGDCGLEESVTLNTPDVEWDGNQYKQK